MAVGEDLDRKRRIREIVRVEGKKYNSRIESFRIDSNTPKHKKEDPEQKVTFKGNSKNMEILQTEYVKGMLCSVASEN